MDFRRDLDDAEMILIGLGSEFDLYSSCRNIDDFNAFGNEDNSLKGTEKLEDSEYAWLIPAYRDYLAVRHQRDMVRRSSDKPMDGVRAALEKLWKLLEGRNYFLISQAQNGMIPRIKWREGRLVMPCGSALKKQCVRNCSSDDEKERETCFYLLPEEQAALYDCCEHLEDWMEGEGGKAEKPREEEPGEEKAGEEKPREESPGEEEPGEEKPGEEESEEEKPAEERPGGERPGIEDEVLRALRLIERASKKDDMTSFLRERIPENILGRCPYCGAGMVLNVVQAAHYDERGYLSDWQRYTKWLQGSVNRKLLVLELGVGMKYPGMIRTPFERVTFLNQKAKMYRIHENLYQVPENLGEKGVGIAENTIDWLNNL